jgi:twitching motility two-component system response regulator PilH
MPTVLYAEDDPEHRDMMRMTLKNSNIILIEAIDGQEALQKIEEQCPDLIVLDLFMPRLDGFSVMEAVRSNPRTRHIPIIILSAWPTGDNRKRTRKAGASEFVAKPYKPAELVKLIERTLAGQANLVPFKPKPDTSPLMA